MKKVYKAPELEIEVYELSSNIAANCFYVINSGPEVGTQAACSDYEDMMNTKSRAVMRGGSNITFYEEMGCDCYTTVDGYFFTS